jgi:hypothetical protein
MTSTAPNLNSFEEFGVGVIYLLLFTYGLIVVVKQELLLLKNDS